MVWIGIILVAIIFNIKLYFSLVDKLFKAEGEINESLVKLSQVQIEKRLLQDELKLNNEEIKDVKAEFKNVQKELIAVNNALSGIEKSNLSLQAEKEVLEAKLHSLKELKKAIRQVKVEYHKQNEGKYIAKIEHQKEIDADKLAQGNRGYLVRNGRFVYVRKAKIEVKAVY